MGVDFTTNKTGMMLVKFSPPEFNLKKNKCVLLGNFMRMTVSHQANMI
jgi:hypothetical protein